MLKVVIVEDELHSREALNNLLAEYCPEVNVIAMEADVQEGINAIKVNRPDLIFLDIELQTGSGFEILKKLPHLNFEVIFTTAYEHYALKAIKFSAIDFLLKPVDVDELIEAVEKVRKKRSEESHNRRLEVLLENMHDKGKEQQTITLSTMEGLEFVRVTDIIRCEALGAYTHFFLKAGKKILVSKNLKEYENILSDHDFFRVHQSHLISLTELAKYMKSDEQVILKNGDVVKVSHSRKESFLNKMKEFQ
jgi:two-component system, LytTR family, response regulator